MSTVDFVDLVTSSSDSDTDTDDDILNQNFKIAPLMSRGQLKKENKREELKKLVRKAEHEVEHANDALIDVHQSKSKNEDEIYAQKVTVGCREDDLSKAKKNLEEAEENLERLDLTILSSDEESGEDEGYQGLDESGEESELEELEELEELDEEEEGEEDDRGLDITNDPGMLINDSTNKYKPMAGDSDTDDVGTAEHWKNFNSLENSLPEERSEFMKGFEQYYKKEEEMKSERPIAQKRPKTPKEQPEKNEKQKEVKRLRMARMENRRRNNAKRMANYKPVYIPGRKLDTIYSSDVLRAHTLIDDTLLADKDLLEQRYFEELQHFEKLETERFDEKKKKFKGDAEDFEFEHDEALLKIKDTINDAYQTAKNATKAYNAAKEANKKARRVYLENPDDNSKKIAMDTAKKSLKTQLLLLEKVSELDLISIIEKVKEDYPVDHIFYPDNTILKKEQAAVEKKLKEENKNVDEKRAKADKKREEELEATLAAKRADEDKQTKWREKRRLRGKRAKKQPRENRKKQEPLDPPVNVTPRVQLRF